MATKFDELITKKYGIYQQQANAQSDKVRNDAAYQQGALANDAVKNDIAALNSDRTYELGQISAGLEDRKLAQDEAQDLRRNEYLTKSLTDYGFKKGITKVPGKGNGKKDTVKAKLAPGEAVLNKAAADGMGRGLISALNKVGARKMGLV